MLLPEDHTIEYKKRELQAERKREYNEHLAQVQVLTVVTLVAGHNACWCFKTELFYNIICLSVLIILQSIKTFHIRWPFKKFLTYLEKRHVGLNFGLSLHLHSFYVLEAWLEGSEDSCKTAHIALIWQAVIIIGLSNTCGR